MWPRKTVGDEAIGGEDPLVMVVISLVSMMTIASDASGMGLYSERYSSVRCKKRFRVCRAKVEIALYDELIVPSNLR